MATAISQSEVDVITMPAPQETVSQFVERTGLKVDDAWRAWNELEDRDHLSRNAFRDRWRIGQ